MQALRLCKLIFQNGSKYGVYVTLHVQKEEAEDLDETYWVVNTISFIKREKGLEMKDIESNEIVTLCDEHPEEILYEISDTILVRYDILEQCLRGIDHGVERVSEEDEVYTQSKYNMSKEVQKGIGRIKGKGNWKETKDSDVLFSLASQYLCTINNSKFNDLKKELEDDNALYKFMGFDQLVDEWVNNEDLDVEKVINSLKGTRVRWNGYYQDYNSPLGTALTNDRDLWLENYYVAYKEDYEEESSVQLLSRFGVGKVELLDYLMVINGESKEWLKKKLLGKIADESKTTEGISEDILNFAILGRLFQKEILDEPLWTHWNLNAQNEYVYIGEGIKQLIENIRNDNIVISDEMIKKLRMEKSKWYLMNKKELTVIKIIFNRDMQIKEIKLQYETKPEYSWDIERKVYYKWDSEIQQYRL